MNAKTLEALDCPFCGASALWYDAVGTKLKPAISCSKCPADMTGNTLAEAIAAWNRRASSTARSPVELKNHSAEASCLTVAEAPRTAGAAAGDKSARFGPSDLGWVTAILTDKKLSFAKLAPALSRDDAEAFNARIDRILAALTAIHPQAEGETERKLPPPDGGGPEPQCGYCARRFWTRADLREHVYQAHSGPAPPHPEPGEL